ncbi:hypothetical protein, conserved [Babesia ovata]|uniref:Uncharacterized protein n=1 Tax=Babesia ovata TaxID=189622 RepID=A0A2H6KDN1_9APIC|nr:uncharacterized protein BOVATA_025900 [Babesia ovata]GBE61097.1 hypothetical protein, conserved [Babesia ovata]
MPSCTKIRQLLPRLRLLGRNVTLLNAADSGKAATKASKQLRGLLGKALQENALADETLVQAADCLYDLKGCNTAIGAQICKAVEQRPHIYTKPLSGGVLWSFYAAGGRSTKRKRVVKSSCVAAIDAFMDELFAIQNDSKNASKIASTLGNLAIVGKCFSLPVSTRARLEQAIIDARENLIPILARSNAIVTYIDVLYRLKIRSDTIAEDALNALIAVASYHEIISTSSLAKTIKTLQAWKIGPLGTNRSAIELLTSKMKTPPVLLVKNPNALVKLYLASTRVALTSCGVHESTNSASNNSETSTGSENVAEDHSNSATESPNHTSSKSSGLSPEAGDKQGEMKHECHKAANPEQTTAHRSHISQENYSNTSDSSVENTVDLHGQSIQGTDSDARAVSGVRYLSALLLRHCCNIVTRCNARLLVVLYNAMCHHILRDIPIIKHDQGYPSVADEGSGSEKGDCSATSVLPKHQDDSSIQTAPQGHIDPASGLSMSDFAICVHTISVEVRDALALDALAQHGTSQPPLTLYDEKDLTTIRRAALVASRVYSGSPGEVVCLAEKSLRDRFGVTFTSDITDNNAN